MNLHIKCCPTIQSDKVNSIRRTQNKAQGLKAVESTCKQRSISSQLQEFRISFSANMCTFGKSLERYLQYCLLWWRPTSLGISYAMAAATTHAPICRASLQISARCMTSGATASMFDFKSCWVLALPKNHSGSEPCRRFADFLFELGLM